MMINNSRWLYNCLVIYLIQFTFISVAEESNSQRNMTPGIPLPEQYLYPSDIREKKIETLLPTQPTPRQYNQELVIPPTVVDGRVKSAPQTDSSITIPSYGLAESTNQRVQVSNPYRVYSCGRETPDLAVTLTNITTYKIDAQICYERVKPFSWNCGVAWGIAPGKSWSHSSCYTTGRYFYEVRGSTENIKFRLPPN